MSDQLITSALDYYRQLAADAEKVSRHVAVIDLPQEPAGYYGLVTNDADGVAFEIVRARAKPRSETLLSLDQLADHVKWLSERDGVAKPVVYYTLGRVIVIHDDAGGSRREDRTTLAVDQSDELTALMGACERPLSQKQMVRLLRVRLPNCLTESSAQLLKVARVISGKTSATSHGKVEHGRESLGRDLESEVISDVGEIPEEVDFRLRWCADPALDQEYVLRVAVELDPQSLQFELSPLADSQRECEETFRGTLAHYLTGSVNVPVFYGEP